MPANGFEDSETWTIIAYLRTLTPGTQKTRVSQGDAGKGEKIFTTTGACSTCHMVKGRGGLLGPDLSRGFRALKTWFTLKTYGTEKLGAVIARTCAVAGYLESRILAEPRLELLAPVQLNIVCFRYRAADANKVNGDIVIDIQESGIAAPSTTVAGIV